MLITATVSPRVESLPPPVTLISCTWNISKNSDISSCITLNSIYPLSTPTPKYTVPLDGDISMGPLEPMRSHCTATSLSRPPVLCINRVRPEVSSVTTLLRDSVWNDNTPNASSLCAMVTLRIDPVSIEGFPTMPLGLVSIT